jgi:hypothetical protein
MWLFSMSNITQLFMLHAAGPHREKLLGYCRIYKAENRQIGTSASSALPEVVIVASTPWQYQRED